MVQIYKKMSTKMRISVVVGMALVLLLSWAMAVGATTGTGPAVSAVTPASGASITSASTTLTFKLTDPDGINDSTLQLKLNGQAVPVTITHPEMGYWETVVDDSCAADPVTYQRWVSQGFDLTQATVKANITALDANTVSLSVNDNIGNNTSTGWNFNCNLPPVISNLTPANASVLSAVSKISAKITDNGTIDANSIVLKIGSNVCPAVFDPATGVVSYTPSPALTEGNYNVYLEVQDMASNKQTASSTFQISSNTSGPLISDFSPADGATVTNIANKISFLATDPQEINKTDIQVKVNGTAVPINVTFPANGHWEDITQYDSCSGDPYTTRVWVIDSYDYTKATVTANISATDRNKVWVSVKDKLGNDSIAEWTFDCPKAPTFSSQFPADGSTESFIPQIYTKIADNGIIDASSIVMKVNSNVVPHTFNATTGVVTFVPLAALPVGTNTVSVEVKDVESNPGTYTWSFQVPQANSGGPVITKQEPANGGSISSTSIPFTFGATDPNGMSLSAKLAINGTNIPISVVYNQLGHYVDEPRVDSCSGETYYVQVWVVDGPDPNNISGSAYLSNLPDENVVVLSVADKAGNTTVKYSTFKSTVPPAITSVTPANDTWNLNYKPVISAQVKDNSSIDSGSIVLKVNGSVVNHTFTPSGAAAGTVSYVPETALPDGICNVTLELKDAIGNLNSMSWKFGVGSGVAAFSDPAPLGDSIITLANPEIKLPVTDILDIKAVNMTVNGVAVPAIMKYQQKGHWETLIDSCTGEEYEVWRWDNAYYYDRGTITYKPANLPDGKNTVAVTVTNKLGGVSTYSWSFTATVPPQISEVYPANGTSVTTRTPEISAKITDNTKIAGYKMLVDNKEVVPVFDAVTSKLSYVPFAQFPNSSSHTVQIIAYDEVGASSTLTSEFHVEIYPDMVGGSNCAACHVGFPTPNHPMNNCDACHDTGLADSGHGDPYCGECHGPHSSAYIPNCSRCHTAEPHAAVSHNATGDMSLCSDCHSPALTREHNRYKDSAGQQLNCTTCHSNTNDNVKQAIVNGQTSCDSCHKSAGHDELHTDTLDANCQTCHSGYLTREHLNNPTTAGKDYSCNTCHSSTAKEVNRTIVAGSVNCGGCHKQGHNMIFADKVPGDIPLYDAFEWTSPIEAAIFAGEPGIPPEFEAGQVVISNRRSDITAVEIADFYKGQLPGKGWSISTEPAPSSNCVASFVYGERKAYVYSYSSGTRDGSGPSGGCRVEIWYK